jgi:hypothetical protein
MIQLWMRKKQQHWIMTIYTDSYRVYRRNQGIDVYVVGCKFDDTKRVIISRRRTDM